MFSDRLRLYGKSESTEDFTLSHFLFQISRKIFDPADHDQPSRKRRVPSPDPNGAPQESNGGQGQRLAQGDSQNIEEVIKIEDTCIVCFSSVGDPKRGRYESLVKCFDCQKSCKCHYFVISCSIAINKSFLFHSSP